MKNVKLKKLIPTVLAILFALLWINSCSSNSSNKRLVRDQASELDSLKTEIVETAKFKQETLNEIQLMYQIETLKSERRSILNINQIYLRKKRPDDRVLEIDNEIKKLEEKLNQ